MFVVGFSFLYHRGPWITNLLAISAGFKLESDPCYAAHQWFSGKIQRCQRIVIQLQVRWAPSSILGWCSIPFCPKNQ